MDVKGKIVFTHQLARFVKIWAGRKGAIGVIQDIMYPYLGLSKRNELYDATQWHFFFSRKFKENCFAFSLSPRKGDYLKELLEKHKKSKGLCQYR